MSDKVTHSLSIYLIKESITQEGEIVTDGLSLKEIANIGSFFYKKSHYSNPRWMKLFAGYDIDELFSSSASALLLINASDRIFAIAFGPAGRSYLRKGVFEERFGLLVTLNSVKKDSIRSIDIKTLETDGFRTRLQSAMPLAADNFGIDVQKDLVKSVTGVSKDVDLFGKTLSGKDSLRATVKTNLENLTRHLTNFLEQYNKEDYKSDYPWIDELREINDIAKIEELDVELLKEFNQTVPNRLWLSVPDIIDWSDHGGYKYSRRKKDELFDDIDVNSFKVHLEVDTIEMEHLTNQYINRFTQSNEYCKDHWRVYDCIYFELSGDSETCFLTDGKWYSVQNSLVQTVNDYYETISNEKFDLDFIDYNHDDEPSYNQDLAAQNNSLCMDKKLIPIEGRSTFEFCDVYTRNKQMIHVKRYSRSSVLSHLFNQGYVSANLLLDAENRNIINDRLESEFKISDISTRPNMSTGEYTVVYAIISKADRDFEMPFFSKMTLMHVVKDLKAWGFNVSIVKINNIKPDNIDGE